MTGYQQHSSPVDGIKMEDRRMSLPAQTPGAPSPTHASPTISRTSSQTNIANLKHEAMQAGQQAYYKQSGSPISKQNAMQQPTPPQQPIHVRRAAFPSPFQVSSSYNPEIQNLNYGPFTTALSMDSAQLLGPALDGNDALASMFMQGNDNRAQQPFYSYNPNGTGRKPQQAHQQPSFEGMNQTLAPSMLDTSFVDQAAYGTPHSATPDSLTNPYAFNTSGMVFDHQNGFPDALQAPSSGTLSGQITPAEGNWQSLIDGDMFSNEQTV